ncbi:Putative protein [Zobellia galactanivorans]|uniref:Uncharacterized protein n=1 Tax=Zobellia galactanivorans (strain DSM 12802 / CCUG 47099 / CIP 106680 / NCIMB 13871 / Dsij) TaxID=63186 RepID=G0KZK5_ZOBGA|nr:Putative protein [Zobellia galactanivorans]
MRLGIKIVFQSVDPATGVEAGSATGPLPSVTEILASGVVVAAMMVTPPVTVVPAIFLMSGMLSITSGKRQFTGATKLSPWV